MENVQQTHGIEQRERRESLQALYGYLETRYKEQVNLLSQVDTIQPSKGVTLWYRLIK